MSGHRPRRLSMRSKLVLFGAATSAIAVLLVCVGVVIWDAHTSRARLVRDGEVLAEVIGAHAASTRVDDPDHAQHVLQALAASPAIRRAVLRRGDGTTLAAYDRGDSPAPLVEIPPEGSHRFVGDALVLVRPLEQAGQRVGSVVLETEVSAVRERLLAIVLLGLIVGLAALGVTTLLAVRISRTLARPLQTLAVTAGDVTARRDWSLRVQVPEGDEVGDLARALNDMLAETQLHQRDRLHAEQVLHERVEQLQREIGERERAEREWHRSEEQLVQARKLEAVGKLAGGVAHDFNNILTAIRGYAEMLLRGLDPASHSWARAHEVLKAGERASGLTRQLLAFGRKEMLQPRVVDLGNVFMSMQRMLQRLIGEDIELAFTRRPGTGNVRVDPTQIEQVILNLVVNARDAMPRGGRITIDLEAAPASGEVEGERGPGPFVRFSVTDDGLGMDAGTRSRIFEPFFTTKDDAQGTGLGLATVYDIVQQSGGHISVTSEQGLGTTFRVDLPRVDADVEPETHEVPLVSLRGTGRLLLVEDDEQVRMLLAEFLEEHGFTVTVARDADEAEAAFAREGRGFDLLVTDLIMPGRSGRELADALCARQPELDVLYMSGYSEGAIVHRGVVDEGMVVLQKPFSPSDLARKVCERRAAARRPHAA